MEAKPVHSRYQRARDLPTVHTAAAAAQAHAQPHAHGDGSGGAAASPPRRFVPNTSVASPRAGGYSPQHRRMRLLDYYNNVGGAAALSPHAAAAGRAQAATPASAPQPPQSHGSASNAAAVPSVPAGMRARPALVPRSPNTDAAPVRGAANGTPNQGPHHSPHPSYQHHAHTGSADAEIARTLEGLSLGIASALDPSGSSDPHTRPRAVRNDENAGLPVKGKSRRRRKKGRGARGLGRNAGEVETFKDYEDYVRHSINSTGGVSTVSTRVMDPLPRTYSARDWRRHERGLYRESAAMNEDSYMYALVLKAKIDRFSPLWQDGALDDIEEGYEGETETESEDEIDTSCCLPACGNGCLGVQCVCSLTGPMAALGACITAGACEWDGGQRRREEDQARRRRCRILVATLRRAGLVCTKVRSLDRKRVLIKVTAPETRLEQEAEKMRLRVQRADGTWARFKRSKRRLFLGPHGGSLFRSSDKQTLINRIIRSPVVEGGAGLGVHSPLSDSIEMAIPLHMYARLMELRNDWLTFWKKPIVAANRPAPAAPYTANPAAKPGHGGPDVADAATVASGTTYSAASVWSGRGQIDGRPSSGSGGTAQVNPASAMSVTSEPPQAVGADSTAVAVGTVDEVDDVGAQRASNGSGSTGGVSEHKGDEGGRTSELSGKTGSGTTTRDSVDTHASAVSNVTWASRGTTASNLKWKSRTCGRRIKDFFGSVLYQPLDRVASYFGESVAFYFAWLEFYTWWLIFPAVCGLVLFIFQVKDGTLDHPLVPVYSLLIALWSTLFLEFWRRRNVELAQRWGVLNYEREEVKRPQFQGTFKLNEATGEFEKHYPCERRALKYVVTASFTLLGLVGVGALMVYIFSTRDELVDSLTAPSSRVNRTAVANNITATVTAQHAPPQDMTSASLDLADIFKYADREEFWLALLLPSALYGLMIPILDFTFHSAAVTANQWENHATESAYRNNLVWKVFPFRFFNSFVSLFYYAFSSKHSILVLSVQLASFVAGSQIWNNIVAVVLPCICRKNSARRMEKKLRRAKLDLDDPQGRALLRQAKSQAWQESRLGVYDTFQDYTEMLIQFGYVTCFSMAFSLAPLVALLNNFVEIRADAYKLCYNTQRPRAQKAGGIGVWFRILQAMSIMSVVTNCVHIAFTSTQLTYYLPFIANQNRLVLTFVFEHIVLGLRLFITWWVPDVPETVKQRVRADNARLSALSLRSEFSVPHDQAGGIGMM